MKCRCSGSVWDIRSWRWLWAAKTYKLKYGHRGGNHGVYDKETKRSYITSQNHGYAVQHESIILKGMEVTHLNLNDGTVEGMEHQ